MTGHVQSDVEFHGESYDGYHVTVAHCAKKFCTKTLKKVEKIHENSSIFIKESFGVGIQFLKNKLKTHIQGVFGVGNNVVKPVWKNNTF